MRNYQREAIIIKRRNIGEADRILTVLTQKEGKIKLRAPGIRRIPSRRSGQVELLNHSILTLYQGSRGLPVLTDAKLLWDFKDIKSDLKKVAFSYHICELLDGLCAENQEQKEVFTLTKETFVKLETDATLDLIYNFEMKLLILLGFWHDKDVKLLNTESLIESILERRLRSKKTFAKFLELP